MGFNGKTVVNLNNRKDTQTLQKGSRGNYTSDKAVALLYRLKSTICNDY